MEDEDTQVEKLTIDEAALKIFRIFVREQVKEILDEINMDAYIDARCRAMVERMKREH